MRNAARCRRHMRKTRLYVPVNVRTHLVERQTVSRGRYTRRHRLSQADRCYAYDVAHGSSTYLYACALQAFGLARFSVSRLSPLILRSPTLCYRSKPTFVKRMRCLEKRYVSRRSKTPLQKDVGRQTSRGGPEKVSPFGHTS